MKFIKNYRVLAADKLLETREFLEFINDMSGICLYLSMILKRLAGTIGVIGLICILDSLCWTVIFVVEAWKSGKNAIKMYQKLERLYKKQALLVLKLREIAAILERFSTDFGPK